jgi:hypothetical protein
MSTPKNVFCNPKKANVQMTLPESCAAKRAIPVSRVRFRGDRNMMNNATPISMYRIVQTGANTTFGGLNQGLFSDAYHVGIELIVHAVDPNTANKGTAIVQPA